MVALADELMRQVTYRLLSRELGIHVNVAKNELAAFYTKSHKSPDQACSATYIISGLINAPKTSHSISQNSNADSLDMDMDLDPNPYEFTPTQLRAQDYGFAGKSGQHDDGDGEAVVRIRLTTVGESGLEDAQAKYAKVNSVTIYSLSPAPIRDADLLCEPSRRIREIDNQKGAEIAKAVGRITGSGIEMRAGTTKAKGRPTGTTTSSVKTTPAAPKLKAGPSGVTSTAAATASTKVEDKDREAVKDEPKLKPKQTGKLNFFAPKPQVQTKEKEGSSKGKMFFGSTASGSSSSKSTSTSSAKEKVSVPVPIPPPPQPKEERPKEEPAKRGTKRKSTAAILSDEEESVKSSSAAPSGAPSRQSSNPPSTRSSPQPTRELSRLRLHKKAIVSDDEDEDDEQPRKKVAKKPRRKVTHASDDEDGHDSEAAKEATKALKSMMDIDDGEAVFPHTIILGISGSLISHRSSREGLKKVKDRVPTT
ncbi:hypothetical protein NP233_g12918 [Leucocoprinus birnbaumii]|uniref:DNA polymerase delta subunit 3 n=1 Tax=Leucocoprinus birnbaumii TaxID=56174 RepID=A0AAD5VDL9_9AGAR|nr:hypothetical protein NP233_g12918 [Leucocoprinus birnbaumii]